MKELKAVIQPYRLAKVRNALRRLNNFQGMTVSKVEGCGQKISKDVVDIREELTDYSPKVLIVMLVHDAMVDEVLRILIEVGHTHQIGGGIVWVTPAEHFTRLSDASPIPLKQG